MFAAVSGLAVEGRLYNYLGSHAEAREHYEQSLALARETGDRRGEANATGSLGIVHLSLGRHADAREHHERWLALAREIGGHFVACDVADLEANGFNLDLRNPNRPDDLAHRSPTELINELITTELQILNLLEDLSVEFGKRS